LRILFVTPRFPHPPLKGDQLVVYHRLRLLGRRHEIALLSFVERDDELEGHPLAELCTSIHTVRLPRLRSVANVAALAPFSRLPLQVLYFHSRRFRRELDAVVAAGRFELVHAYLHRTAPFVEPLALPRVLELQDSMQLRLRHNVAREGAPKRWLWQEELRRMRSYERRIGAAFDHVIVLSEADRAQLPYGNVSVVPNGVDAELFAPRPELRRPGVVVFSGNMTYEPNVHAVTWFARECWPRVRAVLPDARLVIAGSRPAPSVRELARGAGVEVTGWVESMPETLNAAAVAIAPMRSGSGIQNKILEAMACGLPVVTTPLGLGGIGAEAGSMLAVADDEPEFADAVVRLLSDPDEAEAMGRRARDFVLRCRTWERAAEQVEEIYARVVRR
jgi:polysaccharide biosynthesis protein PslH